MIEIPTGLPAELVPLSWLLGVWQGTGVLDYLVGERRIQREFGQRVSFSHDGQPYLNYSSSTWLIGDDEVDAASAPSAEPTEPGDTAAALELGDDSAAARHLAAESGYWRLARPLTDADAGPAMLPGVGERPYTNAESVETLRNASGGFDIEVSLVHPDGVSELYLGQIAGPRIDLATDAVLRSPSAKEYSAATRLYGLVEGHLLWAWDIAALGQDLRTHASARLAKVD
ncbi:FABP family protein [Microbacterium sp. STN6]|uniref:FABP family protein n=1 Tax=Microbacterium sp. STN6 TaxID=2995588 RepID=UPI0022608BB7|nr:FABP family protein [Microbacterium sp. STN6]MCX7523380.1 FABP family protein [Microbacterium sp. STN6]